MRFLPLSGLCSPQHGLLELMRLQEVTEQQWCLHFRGHLLGPDSKSNQKSELYSKECESLQHQRLRDPGSPPTLKHECGVFQMYLWVSCSPDCWSVFSLIRSIELATFQSLPGTLNPTDCISTQMLSYDQHYIWTTFKDVSVPLYPRHRPCGRMWSSKSRAESNVEHFHCGVILININVRITNVYFKG